jgi:hypothetical protein
MKRLRYLGVGQEFADGMGTQRFRVLDIVPSPRRKNVRLWKVECLDSVRGPIGPIRGAFFAGVGAVLFLQGNREVEPA